VPDDRIVVIPNGINEAHFAAAPDPTLAKTERGLSGKLVLGFTGFVRDWHGVDRVIAWMATQDAPANAHSSLSATARCAPTSKPRRGNWALPNALHSPGYPPRPGAQLGRCL
jgi:hypothetical protein